MDSFIYALVMVPPLRELLPRSGIAADQSHVGFYGGLLFALFLVGWGCSLVWGPISDRVGRVRRLMFTILCYSIFTFLGAFATSVWILGAFRLLAGVGIGGEWSMGGTFIAEELPEARRRMAAGLMHTGYYVGIFLAAIANYLVGARYGWRAMFLVGGAPALLVGLIRYGVTEPARWQQRIAQVGSRWTMLRAFTALFWFMIFLFWRVVGGANFAMYTLWLPEQYHTECRASAFAFATSVGRFAGAGITFLVGAGVSYYHTIGTPVALTSLAFLVGLLLLPLGKETKGAPLPA